MVKALGHDVTCDLCCKVSHCADGDPWSHQDVYVTINPRSDLYAHMLKLHLCNVCWPSVTLVAKQTMAQRFVNLFKSEPHSDRKKDV